jgi:GGDEF domain-containing protein
MGAAAGAAVAAAIAQAMKASGVVVRLSPENFALILRRVERPLVVHSAGGFFSTRYHYLTSYRGLAFYTKSREPLALPVGTELVTAESMWMPQ